jgi:hypothetical protein
MPTLGATAAVQQDLGTRITTALAVIREPGGDAVDALPAVRRPDSGDPGRRRGKDPGRRHGADILLDRLVPQSHPSHRALPFTIAADRVSRQSGLRL